MKFFFYAYLALLLVGCQRRDPVEDETTYSRYNDGIYRTIVEGYGGEFEVMIEIKDDKLVQVEAIDHKETPSIGGMAIEQITKDMLEKNTYDVDSVTGATYTSQAIKSGVRGLMDQAKNGDYTKTDMR